VNAPRLALLVVCLLPVVLRAADPPRPVTAAEERQFVEQVLPVLQSKCLACHGQEPEKLKGGLDLRTRAGLMKGGESGKPGLTGKLAESPLWLSVSRSSKEWSAMPPKENDKLLSLQLAAVKAWIEAGSPWPTEARIAELKALALKEPKGGIAVKTSGGLSQEWTDRRYAPQDVWAFRSPVRTPGSSIDEFVARRLNDIGLPPAPLADRRTLLRRVTFDLTGLPAAIGGNRGVLERPRLGR